MATDLKALHSLDSFTSVSFNHLGQEVFGVNRTDRMIGIWDSGILDGTDSLLLWKSIEWDASLQSPDDRIYVYAKSSDSEDLSDVEWTGPVSSTVSETGRYLQIRIVVLATTPVEAPYPSYYSDKIGPTISEMTVKATVSSNSSLFYSKTFDIGFAPKSIVLTDESEVPDGSVLRFGVTSLDSVNLEDYQFIDSNRAVDLDELSVTGEKIKFVIEMSGNSNDEVVVHEFAAIFGGDENKKINV